MGKALGEAERPKRREPVSWLEESLLELSGGIEKILGEAGKLLGPCGEEWGVLLELGLRLVRKAFETPLSGPEGLDRLLITLVELVGARGIPDGVNPRRNHPLLAW